MVDRNWRTRANIASVQELMRCAPVAQWIEHLPCWSLGGEELELIKWTTLYAGTPLEPLVLYD